MKNIQIHKHVNVTKNLLHNFTPFALGNQYTSFADVPLDKIWIKLNGLLAITLGLSDGHEFPKYKHQFMINLQFGKLPRNYNNSNNPLKKIKKIQTHSKPHDSYTP